MVAEEPDAAGAAPTVDEPLVAGMLDAPVAGADEPVDGATVAPELAPGCIADDPLVVEPDPDAVGLSVGPDGVVEVCARTGVAANAVATRHAAICFFSIFISRRFVSEKGARGALGSNAALP
jgi:hypothetical protein